MGENIFVGNLSFSLGEEQLRELFGKKGPLTQ
jgi:RNA recognition motif-containing protein